MESSDGEAALLRRQKLFDDPQMSDFTITIGSINIRVHKAILSLSSPYFDRMFRNGVEPFASIEWVKRHGIRAMIRHIYGFDLKLEEGFLHRQVLAFWTELFDLAGEYEVPSLSKLAGTRIAFTLRSLEMYDLVEQTSRIYRLQYSKAARHIAAKVCRENLDRLLTWQCTKALLKDFPELAATLVKAEFDEEPETAHSRLQEAMKQNPEMALDLLKELAKSSPTAESKKRKRDP